MTVEPIVTEMQVPAGMLGPDPVAIDTRCFLVSHTEGVILIDVGPPGSLQAIDEALARIGATLSDVSDVVLTHSHIDHTGGLADVIDRVPGVIIRAGAGDADDIHLLDGGDVSVVPSRDGDRVRDLEVIETPGHTPGHISLLDRASSLLIAGDAVGNDRGTLSFGPPRSPPTWRKHDHHSNGWRASRWTVCCSRMVPRSTIRTPPSEPCLRVARNSTPADSPPDHARAGRWLPHRREGSIARAG
jgi:glyoxylase-like metal-dependent hydrolase (beta-lactamase superfamily II)